MSEIDLLGDLLSSNPNLPASKGEVLLLRLEMKSEFKDLRSEISLRFEQVDSRFEKVDARFEQVDKSLEDIKRLIYGMSQQIAVLVERSV